LRNLAAGRARRNSMDGLFRYDPLSVADSD
jgi:hypothetical protein